MNPTTIKPIPTTLPMKTENNTTQQSKNEKPSDKSAPAARSAAQNLSVSAAELHMLLDVDSSYEDFRDVEIPRILGRAGLTRYYYRPGESGHRYYSLELAHIIVRSKGDFTGLMATILLEEAMEGMHSAASLAVQIIKVIYLNRGRKLQVDTRELHRFLGVKQPFSLWITRRINDLKIVESRDYSRVISQVQEARKPSLLPRYRWEISVTAEVATDMAMIESSPRGRRVRRYFINLAKMLEPAPLKSWEQFMAAVEDNSKKSTATPS
jgi:phage anti-repressor protein